MQERDLYTLQEDLVQFVIDGDLRGIKKELDLKAVNETGQICTQLVSKIINLQYEQIKENHFLILQLILSIHPNIESSIVRAVCFWLIDVKEHIKSDKGQRILAFFITRGYIGNCQLENLSRLQDVQIKKIEARPETLPFEMSVAISDHNVNAFEASFHNLGISYDIYRKIIVRCVEVQAYDIIAFLLQEYPLNVKSVENVKDCISLLKEHLFRDDKNPNTKIVLLQNMAMSYALAEKLSTLRSFLMKLVDKLLIAANIKAPKETKIQDRINLLINHIDPQYELHEKRVEPSRQYSMHRFFEQCLLTATYLYNKYQTRENGEYDRRNFIDDSIMLGMMPGCKCGLAIISEFKQKRINLGLVVTCQKDAEIRWENLLYTPASPEYWRNLKIQQIQVPIQDFGFKTDPIKVIQALNKMYEVYYVKKQGIYIHCKAGKGRSVFVLALFYVLFNEEMQRETRMDTIKNVYAYIASRRPQISNNEKSWDAVYHFVDIYLNSKLCHPNVCIKQVVESDEESSGYAEYG